MIFLLTRYCTALCSVLVNVHVDIHNYKVRYVVFLLNEDNFQWIMAMQYLKSPYTGLGRGGQARCGRTL